MKTNNPYHPHRVDISMVYGRDQLLSDLVADLNNGRSCAIIGGRKIGKTTVLRTLETALSKDAAKQVSDGFIIIPIYIDLLSLPNRPLPAFIYTTILLGLIDALVRLDLISREFGRDVLLLEHSPGEESRVFGEIVARWIDIVTRRCFVRIAVLFDEVEPISRSAWGDGFFANWRHMLNNAPQLYSNLSAVFAGAREMASLCEDVGSPLANILNWRTVGLLSWKDARSLIHEPTSHMMSDRLARRVFVSTGGHPFLVQFFMHRIWELGQPCTDSHVSAAEETFLATQWQVFNNWFTKFDDADREVYAILAAQRRALPKRDLIQVLGDTAANKSLAFICHTGVAQKENQGTELYRIRGNLFRDWFMREASLGIVPSGLDRAIYAKLSAIDTVLARKYLAAWSINHLTLDNYSGAVGEMRDVITLLLHRLAPDDVVKAVQGYEPEKDNNGVPLKQPTRKQRVAYIASHKDIGTAKAITSEIALLDELAKKLIDTVQSAYGRASGRTHTVATYDQSWKCLKQMDSILAQLL